MMLPGAVVGTDRGVCVPLRAVHAGPGSRVPRQPPVFRRDWTELGSCGPGSELGGMSLPLLSLPPHLVLKLLLLWGVKEAHSPNSDSPTL